jgi:hypothetical protein
MIRSIQTNAEFFRHLPDERLAQGSQTMAENFQARDFVDHNPLQGLQDDHGQVRSES